MTGFREFIKSSQNESVDMIPLIVIIPSLNSSSKFPMI